MRTIDLNAMKYAVFVLLISFMACKKSAKNSAQHVDNKSVTCDFDVPDSTYTMLNYGEDWDWMFSNARPTTLSNNELADIEKIILKAIEKNNKQQLAILEKHNRDFPQDAWTETGYEIGTKGFKRQYVPVINSAGQKEVWVNFFCYDWGTESWKSDILIVSDGGNCYFNLKVNLETQSYSDLIINGYA